MQRKAIVLFVLMMLPTWQTMAIAAELTPRDIPQGISRELAGLIQETFAKDPVTRARAAERLGELGPAATCAVPFLIRLLADEANIYETDLEIPVSFKAADSLKKIGAQAIGPCIIAMKQASRHQRTELMFLLGASGNPQAIDAVIPFINDSDVLTSRMAIRSLWDCEDVRLAAPLALVLKRSSSPDVRSDAVVGLASVRDPRSVDALLIAMNDTDNAVRTSAVCSLGKQQDKRVVPTLIACMQLRGEANFTVRCRAASALGDSRDSRALNPLLDLFHDRTESAPLRSYAANALGRLGNREALAPLLAAVKDTGEPEEVRADVIHSIAVLGGSESLPMLTRLAKSPQDNDEGRFFAALEILRITNGAIDDVDILPPLAAYYKNFQLNGNVPYRISRRDTELKKVILHGKNEAVRSAAKKMLEGPHRQHDDI